jgi:hypothetical protein
VGYKRNPNTKNIQEEMVCVSTYNTLCTLKHELKTIKRYLILHIGNGQSLDTCNSEKQ